jgi:hypothetical protein
MPPISGDDAPHRSSLNHRFLPALSSSTDGYPRFLSAYVEAETGKGADALDRRPSWQPHWLPPALPNAR